MRRGTSGEYLCTFREGKKARVEVVALEGRGVRGGRKDKRTIPNFYVVSYQGRKKTGACRNSRRIV